MIPQTVNRTEIHNSYFSAKDIIPIKIAIILIAKLQAKYALGCLFLNSSVAEGVLSGILIFPLL